MSNVGFTLSSFLGVQRVYILGVKLKWVQACTPVCKMCSLHISFLHTLYRWHEVITSLFYQIRATTVFLTHPQLSRMKGKLFCFPLFYLYLLLLPFNLII